MGGTSADSNQALPGRLPQRLQQSATAGTGLSRIVPCGHAHRRVASTAIPREPGSARRRPVSDPPPGSGRGVQRPSAMAYAARRVGRSLDAIDFVTELREVMSSLAKTLCKVVLDGARAKEQPGADLGVREAIAGEPARSAPPGRRGGRWCRPCVYGRSRQSPAARPRRAGRTPRGPSPLHISCAVCRCSPAPSSPPTAPAGAARRPCAAGAPIAAASASGERGTARDRDRRPSRAVSTTPSRPSRRPPRRRRAGHAGTDPRPP